MKATRNSSRCSSTAVRAQRILRDDAVPDAFGSPRSRHASATRPGGNCCSGITRLFAGSSRGTRGESSTPPVTASSLPSTGRLAPSRPPTRSQMPLPPLGIEVRAGLRTGECEVHRPQVRPVSTSPGPRISSPPAQAIFLTQAGQGPRPPARASRSRIEATASSRASPTPGASSPSLPDYRDLARLGQRSRMSPEGEQADRLDRANEFRPAEPDGV